MHPVEYRSGPNDKHSCNQFYSYTYQEATY